MLAANHYLDFFADSALLPNQELLEVNCSKVSIHHAKQGYDYPTIRLPFTFSGLIGLPTRVYQTVQKGALAFLVVVSSAATEKGANWSENAALNVESSVFKCR